MDQAEVPPSTIPALPASDLTRAAVRFIAAVSALIGISLLLASI